jgi:protein SCO1/2
MLFKVQGSRFNVLDPPPGLQETIVKREPKTGGIAGSCKRHEHDLRARITLFRFVIILQVIFFTLAAPSRIWSHDRRPAQTAKGAERRQVRIPVGDFILTDQASQSFRFQSLRGKVVIVAFAYTTCPDICPLITASMRQVQDGLKPEERAGTYLITVTTDPEIDTPQVLSGYARRYGVDLSNWVFLTGDAAALKKVWKAFGVGVQRKARGLIDHTTLTAVVDRGGTIRVVYTGAAPEADAILRDLRHLLQGK